MCQTFILTAFEYCVVVSSLEFIFFFNAITNNKYCKIRSVIQYKVRVRALGLRTVRIIEIHTHTPLVVIHRIIVVIDIHGVSLPFLT